MSSTGVEARRRRFDQTTIRSASGRLAESLHAPSAAGSFGDVAGRGAGVGFAGFAGWVGGRRTIGCATVPRGADAAASGRGGGGGGGGGDGDALTVRLRRSVCPSRSS